MNHNRCFIDCFQVKTFFGWSILIFKWVCIFFKSFLKEAFKNHLLWLTNKYYIKTNKRLEPSKGMKFITKTMTYITIF